MRSATNNRLLSTWVPPPPTDSCVPANAVWTLAEITSKTAVSGWPSIWIIAEDDDGNPFSRAAFEIGGPTPLTGNGTCSLGTTPTSLVVLDITCGVNPGACIGVSDGPGCQPKSWNFKLGAQWEESYDGGIKWLRLPDTSMNLSSNKITIGMASAATANTDISYTAQFDHNPETGELFQLTSVQIDDTSAAERNKTQFYGVIDSIRISRGVARYTGDVCQPYDPYDSVDTLIDQFVVFALNIGSNEYQRSGSSFFPYYIRDYGWLLPGEPVYPTQPEILAPDIRNFYQFDTNEIQTDGDPVNFYTAHKFLTYSTREAGYRGRCGIQFPSTVQIGAKNNGREAACALVLEDCILPPTISANIEEIYVDYATTENLATDFNGLLWGNKRTVDGNITKDDPAKIILVKDQDNPEQNGIYKVYPQISQEGACRWRRIFKTGTSNLHTYENARIFVKDGKTNAATVWYSTAVNPILGETPITFKQEQPCGVYRDDFCIEAYFKVAGFLQPGLGDRGTTDATNLWAGRRGENMTLLDTYYRKSPREAEGEEYSGVRIYFRPEDGEKTGRLLVDFGTYAGAVAISTPALTEFNDGPALRSGVLQTNVFYHVSVSRTGDVFRLHVNGILEDSLVAQDTKFKPQHRTREQNYMRYRGRGFYGLNSFATTQALQFRVKQSEIFFKTSSPPYATRFNGAAGMVLSDGGSNLFLNYPSNPDSTDPVGSPTYDRKTLFTSPGAPIPDYAADTHVYIFNNLSTNTNTSVYFNIKPLIRFPEVESIPVYLATVAADELYTPNDNLGTTQGKLAVPGTRGNLSLYGLFEEGERALGNIKLRFSTLAARTIPKRTIFRFGSVEFTPRIAATFSKFNVVTSGSAGNDILVLQSEPGGGYTVQVPVIATATGANGNLSVGATLTLGASFGGVAAASTANIPFLYGLLTIDGVTLTANQRILVKDQTVAAQNGIYTVKANTWERDVVLSKTEDALYGKSVRVTGGTTNNGKTFFISNSSILSLGASNLNWLEYLNNLNSITALTFNGNGRDDGVTQRKIDGVAVEDGTRILVKNQDDATTNGIYVARPAAWERASDMNQTSEIQRGVRVSVKNGYTNAGQAFNIDIKDTIPDNQILLGVTEINFAEDTDSSTGAKITTALEDNFCVGIGTEIADESAAVVMCITTAHVGLSGLSESGTAALDYVNVLIGEEVLVCQQNDPAENGIYVVRTGAWRRATYLNKTEHFITNFSPDAGSSPPTRSMLVAPRKSSRHIDLDDSSTQAEKDLLLRQWDNRSSIAGYAEVNYIRDGWRIYIKRDNFLLGVDPITIAPATKS